MRVLGWFFLLLLIGGLVGVFGARDRSNTPASAASPPPAVVPAVAPVSKPDYETRLKEAAAEIASFDFSPPEATMDDIAVTIALIDLWAALLDEGTGKTLSAEEAVARSALLKQLSSKQAAEMPRLRDAYGPAMRRVLWESDGKARTIGNGFRTVEFINGAFAANRNIAASHEKVYLDLLKLRFTRAQYKWIDADVEYSYYTIKPPRDGEVIAWSGQHARVVK